MSNRIASPGAAEQAASTVGTASSNSNGPVSSSYPEELLSLVSPTPPPTCPSGCPSRSSPPSRPNAATPRVKKAIKSIYKANTGTSVYDLASHNEPYLKSLSTTTLSLIIHMSRHEPSQTIIESLKTESTRQIAKEEMERLLSKDPSIVPKVASKVFCNTLDRLVDCWNTSTRSNTPCVHSFDKVWSSYDVSSQVSAAADNTSLPKSLSRSEQTLPPIDHLVERVQTMVASREIRGKPWNRPRECRAALFDARIQVHRVLLPLLRTEVEAKLDPILRFFETIPDPVAFFINLVRLDHEESSGHSKLRTRDPGADDRFRRAVTWLLNDKELGIVPSGATSIPTLGSPPSSSPSPSNGNSTESKPQRSTSRDNSRTSSPIAPSSSASGRKPALNPVDSSPKPSTPATAKSTPATAKSTPSTAATGKTKPSASVPPPPPASKPSPPTANGTSNPASSSTPMSAAAQTKFAQLKKERTRIEKEISAMESKIERLRNLRRVTDKDLFSGELSDQITGYPRALPLAVGLPTNPAETSPHSSPLFTNLPHYNPVKVCSPHLHRHNSVFNHNAFDSLDYALTTVFTSSLVLEIYQVEGPLLLEAIRNAALSVLFQQKIDQGWDAQSTDARNTIKRILQAILNLDQLRKLATTQPMGNNALPAALIEARTQIQQAVAGESPRLEPYSDQGSPCICELTNHVPAIQRLSHRLNRASAVRLTESLRAGGSIDRARVLDMLRQRSGSWGPKWQNGHDEKQVDQTLSAFESQWLSTLTQVSPDLRLLWEPTEELVKWIGGARMWEESKRVTLTVGDPREALRSKVTPYSMITSRVVTLTKLGKTLRPDELVKYKSAADAAMKVQDYETAAPHYDLLALLDPSHVAARTNAALARVKSSGLEEAHLAISDCTAALAYSPRSVKALYRRSIALQRIGKRDLAIKDLELALSFEPSHREVSDELDRLNGRG